MTKLSASLMCADPLDLKTDIKALEEGKIDLFHIDIMDGHFVPNITMNTDILSHISKVSDVGLDVHLMVDDPMNYIKKCADGGAKYVSFHKEVSVTPIRVLREIRKNNMKAGIAFNPSESIDNLKYFISEVDFVLLMSVEPGFAGQAFIEPVYEKIKQVREMSDKVEIQIDGCINVDTARKCILNGADILVLGTSSIFKKECGLTNALIDFKNKIS